MHDASKIYEAGILKLDSVMSTVLQLVRRTGQSLLLRLHILQMLRFGAQLDAQHLYHALQNFNFSFLTDFKESYYHPERFRGGEVGGGGVEGAPSEEEDTVGRQADLICQTTSLLECTGLEDALQKVYVTSQPLENLPEFLLLFILHWTSKVSEHALSHYS